MGKLVDFKPSISGACFGCRPSKGLEKTGNECKKFQKDFQMILNKLEGK